MAGAMTRPEVARTNLVRHMPFTLEREGEDARTDGDGLTLEGHAAVFNSPTVIDSWEGRFTEEIAPGAFRKSFRTLVPKLQFDHGHHPLLGSIPLGRFVDNTPREDETGAFVRAELENNWMVQPVRDAIASGTIDGMSFRFSVLREEWRDEDGKLIKDDEALLRLLWSDSDFPKRTLREVKVPELGPVVFPAYTDTEVSVRSGTTVIDLGQYLRRNPEEGKTLARALFVAERATVEDSEDESTQQTGSAPASDEPDTQQTGSAPVEEEQPTEPDDRTAVLAAEMRARLERLHRG